MADAWVAVCQATCAWERGQRAATGPRETIGRTSEAAGAFFSH